MKIVYCSQTGFTERYAKMLAKKLKIKEISVDDYQSDEDEIIYMGSINAGIINKYKNFKNEKIICTIGVGISYDTLENKNKIVKTNSINEPFFYLQGGIDYTKVNKFMKIMFKFAGKLMNIFSKDKELTKVYLDGGDFIKEENLREIIKFIQK